MILHTFIRHIVGDPPTCLHLNPPYLAFGTISGVSALFNLSTKKIIYNKNCEREVIRQILVRHDSIIVFVNDDQIKIYDFEFRPQRQHQINEKGHARYLCSNYCVLADKQTNSNTSQVESIIVYCPTND